MSCEETYTSIREAHSKARVVVKQCHKELVELYEELAENRLAVIHRTDPLTETQLVVAGSEDRVG